jgi:RNA polymerase sporulation-specific sigma factor
MSKSSASYVKKSNKKKKVNLGLKNLISAKDSVCSSSFVEVKKVVKPEVKLSLIDENVDDLSEESVEIKIEEEKVVAGRYSRDMLEQIMFRLPCVIDPLIGTPKQVKKELDALAKKMQKHPRNEKIFNKIHLYMHGYLINVVLKKFPFIKGYQTVDVYQEALIALRFKAIPGFKYGKGMSFLNFAKMCIRRHLITLLNSSINRKKDQSMNQAISLDSSPVKEDEDESRTTFANIIADTKDNASVAMETNEAYEVTKKNLFNELSDFEKIVLNEYLSSSSYREISKNVSKILKKKLNTKSIDNALLRIRKKAINLLKFSKKEDVPIFLPKTI